MPDFNAHPGLVDKNNEHSYAICNRSRRYKMYEQIPLDAIFQFFEPPLKFNPNGSIKDLTRVNDKK